MADQRPPSFFHILMNPSSPHLPLPPKFVTKHLGNKILKDSLIKSANGGYLWKLKMKKIDDHSYGLVDGWCNVVKDVGLLFGEFMLFRYVGSSVFLMHVYSVNGCEKILVPKIKVPSFKVVDYGCIDDDDVDDEVEEEDDVVYDVDDDGDHHHVEDEDDVEFVDDGDEDDDMEEVEDEDDVDFVNDGDTDDVGDDDDMDDMDDMDVEDDNDKDEDEDFELVDEDDPFFVVTITPTHNHVLRMPTDFVRSAGIDTKKTLMLRSLDGYEMAMPVQFDTQYGYHAKRYFLLKGWKDFMQGTNISEGDKCVFKFITSEDKLCLAKITKPPPAAEALETEVNDDDDKDEYENENEDVEPVDDVDPFFVATITTDHKSRLYLPTDFVRLAGIDTKENIIMISLDGSENQMAIRKGKRHVASTLYQLSEGWRAFMHSNNISQGDKCVLKYITSEDKMCLAKIIKAPATKVDVNDGDPSFVVTISITHKHMLRLPPDFVALARIDTKENIIMKSLDGNESQMAVRPDKRFKSAQYNLSLGWVAFKQRNNISQGDECVFKYITSEDKMCLVKITKASATEVDDGMDVEDDNDTNDDADPFFVGTIIPSHKSMLLLPADFVALARIGTKKNIIIKSLDGNETQMALQSYELRWSTRYCFSVGWMAFKRSNNISDGDECVFKYIRSEDKMCLAKITKKITRATELPAEVDNDDMGDEDVDEEGKGEDAKLADEDDDNDNEEDAYDYDGDPFFILTISKANQYKLRFSPDFVALARIDTRETITLKNDDGCEKEMPVHSDKRRKSTSYYVATGWKEFQQSNDISQGDKYVFKFIISEDKICLAKITERKSPARSLPPAAEAPVMEVDADDVEDDDIMDDKDTEDGNDEDDDEDVELVDEDDPFFVTTINKRNLYLPIDFVRLAGIDTKENIIMISLDGNECEMTVWKDTRTRKLSTQYYLSKGWHAFMRSNNISQGDKCVFKYITSEDKVCLAKIIKAQPAQAKKVDVYDEDPSFVVTITTMHNSMLRFLSDFVTLAGIDKKKTIIFKNLNGFEKEMAVQRDKQFRSTTYFVASGWKEFLRDTDISEGDICVFKFIRSEDKICLAKITKKKTPAGPPPGAIKSPVTEVDDDDAAAADDDDDENEDVECVDDGDPFFVVTINHKYMLYMPVDFVRSAGIDTKKTLTLLGLDGYEMEMPVRYHKKGEWKGYYVNKRWPEFQRNNAILEGDKCVFKFITSDDKLCLAKINKKNPTSSLPPATDDDEDENEDVERVYDEDPFFVATVNHKFILRLPPHFVALAKIDTREKIIIRSLDGNERQMAIHSFKQFRLTRYHFSLGWPAFRRSNNISEGDECVFKYIRSEDKMCLVRVTKRNTQARSSPPTAVDTETRVDADDVEDDDGIADEDEDEAAELVEDDDPFFVVTITQSNLKSCLLRFPVDFVRSVGIDTKKTITLKSLDGYEKEMPVRVGTKYHYQAKRYFLSKGWTDFVRCNNISVGDKCVFKFITSEDKLCLAKITKARPTQIDDDDVEVDNGMDDKDTYKDVELFDGVDDGDPFFAVTITTIHKSMLRLPSDFVTLSRIDTEENIIIKSLDGNERLMALRSCQQNDSTHYCLSMGWPAFMRSNSILEGDECVFKYITSEDKMCLAKITKKETRARPPPPATETPPTEVDDSMDDEYAEVDDNKDKDENVELDDGMDDNDVNEYVKLVDGMDDKDMEFDNNNNEDENENENVKLLDDGMDDKDVDEYVKLVDGMDNKDEDENVELVDDRDPFFRVTISPNHKSILRLPPDFVGLAGINTKKNITVKSLDGDESQMAVRSDRRFYSLQYHLAKGWVAFMQCNNISEGDECVFKYITSEDKMCLAKIIKTSATEVDADPYFVVTMTPGHKSRLWLPTDFVGLAGIDTKKNIMVKSLDGNETQMTLIACPWACKKKQLTRYCLSMGWSAFKRSNNISEGDECVFKYLTSEDKMCLAKVTKEKIQTRLPSPAEVVKRKRGQLPPVTAIKMTAAETVKMRSRRPPPVEITVAEAVKRKRGQPPPSSPRVTKDMKRKKGPQPHVHSAEGVEVTKKPRGRPAK